MGNQKFKANVFFVLALLSILFRTTNANALVSNLKSFAAGGVGGMLLKGKKKSKFALLWARISKINSFVLRLGLSLLITLFL